MSLIRMSLQKLLPLLQHQKVQKPPMVLLHLLFHIGVEKLLCLLQSPQTLLSLNHEGFACSHLGVSSIWLFCFHATGATPSLLLHTTPYAIPITVTDSNHRNAVSCSSARTTKRFPASQCASTIQIARRCASNADTQPQFHPALLRLSAMISQYFYETVASFSFDEWQ